MEIFSSVTVQVKWFKQKISKELQDYFGGFLLHTYACTCFAVIGWYIRKAFGIPEFLYNLTTGLTYQRKTDIIFQGVYKQLIRCPCYDKHLYYNIIK